MESLIYFVLWAGLFFLMMRVGCGAHVAGHGHGRGHGNTSGTGGSADAEGSRWVPPEKDTDPVCGNVLRTETAKSSVHDGWIYYFCSRDCREIFEAAPEMYLEGGTLEHRKKEHSHA